jgi:hypothetical protein
MPSDQGRAFEPLRCGRGLREDRSTQLKERSMSLPAKSPLPRGIRNHNPGNLRRSKDPWQGLAVDQSADAEFFVFSAPRFGIRALARVLIQYYDRHNLFTVRGIISRWAPPVENNTDAYVAAVARALKVTPDQAMDLHDYARLKPLVVAIIRHENGVQPYSAAVIDDGLRLAGVEPPAQPIAASRTVQGGTLAAGGSALALVAESVRAAEPALPVLQHLVRAAPWALAVLALAGAAYVLYAYLDDRRAGRR